MYRKGNYIQYPMTNYTEKEYVCMSVTELLCCTEEINTTLYINYTAIIFLKKLTLYVKGTYNEKCQ